MNIYKILNTINGKIYIGKNSTDDESYFGSGTYLRRAISKYGKHNFKKEILEEGIDSLDLLNEREIFWIDKLDSCNRSIGYNLTIGGDGGDTFSLNPNKKEILKNIRKANRIKSQNPETKKKISESSKRLWKDPDFRKKIVDKLKGRDITWKDKIGKTIKKRYSETPPVITEETKQKLREAMTGYEFKKYSDDIENRVLELYSECGPKTMSKRLLQENINISPYKIISILKKHGVYQRYRKKRPELKNKK